MREASSATDRHLKTNFDSKQFRPYIAALAVCICLVFGFQNCSEFKSAASGRSSQLPSLIATDSGAPGLTPPPPSPTPSTAQTPPATATPGTALAQLTLKILASSNTGYATAGFHPRVVANGKGIFVAYETDRDDSATTERTHIDWSRDGGSTFTSLFSKVMSSTASSSLQFDEEANLFMADLDQANTQARVFVFNGYNNFAEAPNEIPIIYPPGTDPGSTKFTFFYAGNNLAFFSDKHRLFSISLSTQTVGSSRVLINAPDASGFHGIPQYPLLTKTDLGQLIFGWTTSLLSTCASTDTSCTASYLGGNHYLDNHFILSSDLGQTWTNANSTLTLPVISDSQDSTTGGIELTSQADVGLAKNLQGDNFLHSIFSKGNFIHFAYLNTGGSAVVKYGRYNISSHGIDISPTSLKGQTITLNSNGITLLSQPGYPLYAVGATNHGDGTGSLGVLESIDDGATWNDFALDTSTPGVLQYINASVSLTTDGAIVGEFTKQNANDNQVYFFKVPARASSK